ncbi:GNAT family N-acetyltransferase [Candidatus Korobacter versatilis]|nr:GNAT family N-acetyltransferase [Candidatus Koribacter versatilis]
MNGARPSSDGAAPIATHDTIAIARSQVTLVPRQDGDAEFLYRVYASTRAEEVAQTGWPMEMQEQFLRMQFNAQTSAYAMQTPTAEHSIIHVHGEPAGRMILERTTTELHLVDIALLPEYRNLGVGSLLMGDLLAEAEQSDRKIHLYVERFNPALQWYERMGFVAVTEGPIYLEMYWRPQRIATSEDKQ